MRLPELRCKELISYLALHWANCSNDLEVFQRGITVPPIPTVYLLLDSRDTIKYVGHSSCLTRRIAQHVANPGKEKLLWTKIGYFAPKIISKHRRLQVESALIALAVPEGNKVIGVKKLKNDNWADITWTVRRKARLR